MKVAVAFVAVFALVAAQAPLDPLLADLQLDEAIFRNWTAAHGKVYTPEDYPIRFGIFVKNMERIAELRREHHSGSTLNSIQFGLTKFADLTFDEFKGMYLNYKPSGERPHAAVKYPTATVAAPSTVDWRKEKKVTPVKNQGQCGSCWAFSATEQAETQWAMMKSELVELSVQQTVSCDTVDQGCNGGDTPTAYKYMAGGVMTNKAYPYTSGNGDTGTCQDDPTKHVLKVTNFSWGTAPCYNSCDKQNLDELAANVAAHGPASICVNANDAWQFYLGGVMSSSCSHAYSDLDHCVQLVGYDTASPSYWLVRNSWGESWGEAGYIYVAMANNLCGIADEATFVEVAAV